MSWGSSEPAADRFFGAIAYLLPIADVVYFGSFVFTQLPIFQELYRPLLPLLMLNGDRIGSFILFFALYLGVVVNPRISRFVRFNVLQSILISILLALLGLIDSYVLGSIPGIGLLRQILFNTAFFGTWAAAIYGIAMSALGRYAEMPVVSEAAHSQIGRY